MEDVVVPEEPILDIDVSDSKNTLAAVEYVQDLYAFYRKMEVHYGFLNLSLKQQERLESLVFRHFLI